MTTWLTSTAFSSFGAPTSWAEVLGFVAGALCVWMVARQNIWNWPLGILNNALWVLLFATSGLYGDSGLQVVYIALALFGWYQWLHVSGERRARPVRRTTSTEWAWIAGVGAVGTVGLYFFLEHLTSSTVPLWDALTTGLSLAATYGQIKKLIESWWLWILADVIYVPLYHHKGLDLTAILYVGFAALCVRGLINWNRSDAPVRAAPVAAVKEAA
jgi:nicotinamide mononucleotide transporter